MRAYGENEHKGKYVLEDYQFSRNHTKGIVIKRYRRHLKKIARLASKSFIRNFMKGDF